MSRSIDELRFERLLIIYQMIFAEVEDQVLFKFRGLEKIDNINDTIMMQLLIQFQKYILSIDYSQYKYIYISFYLRVFLN